MSATAIGIGVGAATLAGSLINSYQNLKQQADINDTNYRIWQEQLAAQKENWKQQQANFLQQRRWQLEDTANQRAYDSPVSQMARYRAAGINPYIAQQFGSSQSTIGTPQAPSFGSVPSVTPMQSQNVDFGFGLASQNAANAYFMASKNETDMQVAKQHANNETLDTMSKMIQRGFQNEHFKQLANQIAQQTRFDNESWAERFEGVKLANESIKADTTLKHEQVKTQRILNEFKPKEQEKILRNLDKVSDELDSKIRNNDADSAYKIALKGLSNAQREGVNIDNATKQEYAGSIVAQKAAEADMADFNAQMSGRKYYKGEFLGTKTTGADANNDPINFRNYNPNKYHRRLVKNEKGEYIFGFSK